MENREVQEWTDESGTTWVMFVYNGELHIEKKEAEHGRNMDTINRKAQ